MLPKRKKTLLAIDYLSRSQVVHDYLKVKDLSIPSEESLSVGAS